MEKRMRYQTIIQAVKAAAQTLDAAAAAVETIIEKHLEALRAAGYPCENAFVPTAPWRAFESRNPEEVAMINAGRAHGHPHVADYKAAERGQLVLSLRKEAAAYRRAAADFRRAPVRVLESVLANRSGNGKEAEATCNRLLAETEKLRKAAEQTVKQVEVALKSASPVAPLPPAPAKKEAETRPLGQKGFKGFGPKPAPKVEIEAVEVPKAPAVTAAPAPAPAKAVKPVLVGKGLEALAKL